MTVKLERLIVFIYGTIYTLYNSPFSNSSLVIGCNGVQREHNKKLNNGLPILHKVPPKRDYGRYFCIMAEKGGTSHGGLTEKLSPFFHAKKQEVNGRMIEIYLLTSLAPIPFATVPNRETGHMGQNYFRSLFAVGFQGLLILVCVAIYAVLIQSIATDGDPIGAIWGCVGYTVLLCFTLFKTGSLAKSIFGCH